MSGKYFNFDIYSEKEPLRIIALVLTSFVPLLLLFSRVAADTALTITGILFLVHSVRTRNYNYIKEPIVVTLLLLWLWFIICSFFAFYSVAESFATSLVFIRFILFFLACVYWLFTEPKALKFAVTIITITIILAASDALLQFITGFSISGKAQVSGRLTSFLRRPDIGIYLAKLLFPIAGFWICSAIDVNSRKSVMYSCLLLFFVIGVILLTGERTATILSLSALILILLIISATNRSLRIYMILGIVAMITVFSVIVYNSPFIHKRVTDFVGDISNFPDSLYGQLFQASILSWQKYGFFTGVGIRQFRHSCPGFEESGLVTYCDLHSHNIYFEILSESGIIGIGLFVTFVLLCLHRVLISATSRRQNQKEFIGSLFVLGGFITILFPISVTMSFITNWSGTLNWTGIALCVSILKQNRRIII